MKTPIIIYIRKTAKRMKKIINTLLKKEHQLNYKNLSINKETSEQALFRFLKNL